MDARYRQNAGSTYSLKDHIVWCPKYRRAVLVDAVADRLKSLLAEARVILARGLLARTGPVERKAGVARLAPRSRRVHATE
jgi:hypothetical protein